MPQSALQPTSGPDVDEEIFEAYHDIVMAGEILAEAMHRRIPAMDGHGLVPFVLRKLQKAGRRGLSQVEFARLLGRSASSGTRLVDTLEKAGVVRREAHPNDRRVNMLRLTPHGDALIDSIFAALTRTPTDFPHMTPSDVSSFRAQISGYATIADRYL